MPDDSTTGSGPNAQEVAWFVEHHQRALGAARRIAHAHAVLDGGLDVAHARGDLTAAALVLKYQIDADLLTDLGAFRRECLADVDVEQTPRLAALWAMLAMTLDHISEHLPQLIGARQARPEDLYEVRTRLRDISVLFDGIIDGCVEALAAPAP